MTALTPLDKVTFDHEGQSAWVLLLTAETSALVERTDIYTDSLVAIRVVGHLLEDFWNHQESCLGRTPYYNQMLFEINSCRYLTEHLLESDKDAEAINEKLYELGLIYRNHILRVFRSDEPRKTPFEPLSRNALGAAIHSIVNGLTSKSDVEEQALFRDGHRCVVTAIEAQRVAGNFKTINMELAHIFSESAQDDENTYGAATIAMLKEFGLESIGQNILGGNVNSLANVMTMATTAHFEYDMLRLWLELVPGQPNTYDVCGPHANERHKLAIPPLQRITFRISPKVEEECRAKSQPMPDLPSPELLTLRAACSRVVLMSGAAEQVDNILRDLELSTVLSHDGSMADLLASRLSMVSPVVIDFTSR